MNKKTSFGLIIVIVLIVLAVGGIAFYAGMRYAGMHRPTTGAGAPGGSGPNGGFTGGGGRLGGGVTGQITALDNSSITLTMRDGSTEVVALPDGVGIDKTIGGAVSDLAVGEEVVVVGTTTSDGTFTASSVSIRPAGDAPAGAE